MNAMVLDAPMVGGMLMMLAMLMLFPAKLLFCELICTIAAAANHDMSAIAAVAARDLRHALPVFVGLSTVAAGAAHDMSTHALLVRPSTVAAGAAHNVSTVATVAPDMSKWERWYTRQFFRFHDFWNILDPFPHEIIAPAAGLRQAAVHKLTVAPVIGAAVDVAHVAVANEVVPAFLLLA
eukprot:CAMPEP_0170648388 /NCGR_PEP_ID=MMETSP0224-20130122/44713_1 /TAXON_ID=285029 /ORGANISM="Togula jolla, Strain CCCM 725" /LENGTH=179 /DNA_ID=CAMNT_0010979921 /DNA_START=113 /DNA_END=649 /DNA_ORIENTATION=-